MKKLLFLLATVGVLTTVSCKKENEVAPESKGKIPYTLQGGPKKDLGQYD